MTESRRTCTIDEFARLAGISRTHAYKLVQTDERLKRAAIHLGRRVLLPRAVVDEILPPKVAA